MTALFWILAAGLTAAGVASLAWPLLRGAPPARIDRRAATLAAHRARLTETAADDAGLRTDPAVSTEAQEDIARSLLRDLASEVRPAEDPSGGPDMRPRRGTAIAVAIAFPLLAVGTYAVLGEPRGLHPPTVRDAARIADTVAAVVDQLLAEAEALALANRDIGGKPARLVEQALVLAPDHRQALWLAVIAALHENRAEDARARLERLRGLGPLGGEEARMFERLMNETVARLSGP